MAYSGNAARKIRRPKKTPSLLNPSIDLSDVEISAKQLKRLFGMERSAEASRARKGDTVLIHYSGRRGDGTLFDTTRSKGPIRVTIGDGSFLAAFEHALIGMRPGTRRRLTIPAHHAYGAYREDLLTKVDRAEVPSTVELAVGTRLGAEDSNGNDVTVRISAIEDHIVTLDANHPLAGQDLTFDIQVLKIIR